MFHSKNREYTDKNFLNVNCQLTKNIFKNDINRVGLEIIFRQDFKLFFRMLFQTINKKIINSRTISISWKLSSNEQIPIRMEKTIMMQNEPKNKSVNERLEDSVTFSDLLDAFSLRELVILTQDGILEKWLNEHLFEDKAQLLSNARGRSHNSDAVLLALVNVLDVDVTKLSDYEAELVTRAVLHEREIIKRERECGKDGVIVTNQRELVEALSDKDTHKIYLCDETFSIPLNRGNITYDGRGNALINIFSQGDALLDFDGNGVYFYNLTIVFHFLKPHQVKIDHSSQNHNHIIFLHENRIVKDDSVQSHELAAFLNGRTPFESKGEFAERAVRFYGVIVGRICLNDRDYDLWHEAFFLNPVWRVEFTECIRRYVRGAKLFFQISCEEAKALFECERAQLIYANFGTNRDNAVIVQLYLQPNNGHGKIYPLHRLFYATSCSFGSGFIFSSGSDSNGAGYGLNLIAVDN